MGWPRLSHRLEAVQVQQQHRQFLAVALGPLQGVLQAVVEEGAVGQAGEGVEMGQPLQFVLGMLDGGNVGEDADVIDRLALLVEYGIDGQPLGEEGAVLAPVPYLAAPDAGAGQGLPHQAVELRFLAVRTQQAGQLAQGFGGGVAGDVGECLVHREDDAPGVGDHDPVGGVLHDHPCQAQLFRGLLDFRDVGGNAEDAAQAAVRCRQRAFGGEVGARHAAVQGLFLEAHGLARLHHQFVVVPVLQSQGGGHEAFPQQPFHGGAGAADHLFEEAVAQAQAALRVEHVDQGGGMVHDGAEQAALPLQFRLGLLALGDVAHHGMEHRQLVELHGAEGHFRREQAAVAALVGPFEAVQAPGHGDFHHGLGLLRRGLAVGLPGRRQVDGGNAPELGKILEAEHFQGRRVGLGKGPLADDPGGVGGIFEEGTEAPLALGQGGLDFLALGDFSGEHPVALANEPVAPHQLGDEIEQQQGVGQGHQEQGRVQQIGAGPARLGQARQLPGAAGYADVHQHWLLGEYRTVAPDHAAVGAFSVFAA